MKKLNFTYIAAKNFVCFGEEGIEIDFTKKDKIVLIRGENFDVFENEDRASSNGTGKSSIVDILVFCLFGKPVKNPKKIKAVDLIHNKSKGKTLHTEVRWDNYRVVRTMKKSQKISFYEKDDDGGWEDISPGSSKETQQLIEDKLGLTYESFVNVMVFTDNNAGTFLESDNDTKRKIIDNLLSLHRFRSMHQVAYECRRNAKADVKSLLALYQQMTDTLEHYKSRISSLENKQKEWREEKQRELTSLKNQLKIERDNLKNNCDQGEALIAYEDAQLKIKELNASIPELQKTEAMINEAANKIKTILNVQTNEKNKLSLERQKHQSTVQHVNGEIDRKNQVINAIFAKEGTKCPTCFSIIKEENYKEAFDNIKKEIAQQQSIVEQENTIIVDLESKISAITTTIEQHDNNLKICTQKNFEVNKRLGNIRQQISDLANVRKPEAKVDEAVFLQKISQKETEIKNKEIESVGPTPYDEILQTAKDDIINHRSLCQAKEDELTDMEASIPYYEFIVKAFDTEIRKFVIDGILPGLNNKISYWLQFLIDGKIRLQFDNQLSEYIERNPVDGDPFVYHAMSGGERRRINLAVSQAFAYIMMLSSGSSPSLVFLDEVTTNVDPIGVEGIYQMIQELSRDKQVCITTHDQGLLEKLDGCDQIVLQKRDGTTTLRTHC